MLNVIEVYQDSLDTINKDQNGELSIEKFNRFSRRGELRFLDWLSGDISNEKPPIPFLSQKNKDWLSPFITKFPAQVVGGTITKPADYYGYDNFYKLGSPLPSDCEDDISNKPTCNPGIEILGGDEFNIRCKTFIEELKPKNKPIAKEIGNTFEVEPKDLGSVVLEYIRYPKFGLIVSKVDPVYNDVVPDPAASTNYEWSENAREILVWCIVDSFFNSTREQAGKQFNSMTGKTVRDMK